MTFAWPSIPEPKRQYSKLKPRQVDVALVEFMRRWPMRTIEEIAAGLGVKVGRVKYKIPHMVNTGKAVRYSVGRIRLYSLEAKPC